MDWLDRDWSMMRIPRDLVMNRLVDDWFGMLDGHVDSLIDILVVHNRNLVINIHRSVRVGVRVSKGLKNSMIMERNRCDIMCVIKGVIESMVSLVISMVSDLLIDRLSMNDRFPLALIMMDLFFIDVRLSFDIVDCGSTTHSPEFCISLTSKTLTVLIWRLIHDMLGTTSDVVVV